MKKTLLSLALLTCSTLAFASGHGPHWGYQGADGAENWGKLHPDFALCSAGKNQSPIDITNTLDADTPAITFNYSANGSEVIHNGHTIQVNFAAGSSITLRGNTYQLKQFHFHSPSENLIDGKSYPLEGHLVHSDDKGNLAVIGVMFNVGEANPVLSAVWAVMPEKAGGKNPLSAPVNAAGLLPSDQDYYRFNGSLTTPPCSEGVTWIVMKQAMTASQAQINQFIGAMGHSANNRPVQPVNARPILK
jgi:carbonic anhydrase